MNLIQSLLILTLERHSERTDDENKDVKSSQPPPAIFGLFKSLPKPLTFCLSLRELHTVLKTVGDKTGHVVLSIKKGDSRNLTLRVRGLTPDIKTSHVYKLRLMSVEEDGGLDTKPNPSCKISMRPAYFFKICKDVGAIGEEVGFWYDYKNFVVRSSNTSGCGYVNVIGKRSELIVVKELGVVS